MAPPCAAGPSTSPSPSVSSSPSASPAASALLANRNAAALDRVVRTQDTRTALTQVLTALEGAETGQRGFLLTRKDAYLAPYRQGAVDTPRALDSLGVLLGPTTPGTDLQLARLRDLATDKLNELAQTIAQLQSGDAAAALDLVQSDRGQRDMIAIREIIAAMERQQQATLAEQVQNVDHKRPPPRRRRRSLGFILLAALAAAIAWGARLAFISLRAAQSELTIAYQALTLSNATLEERVAARTAALTEANEEIQRFAYIVSHDLRAPLVNIMGFTSEMESANRIVADFVADAANEDPEGTRDLVLATTEDIPESIRFIKTSTAKMDRLIGAILKLSREGRRVLTAEPVAMRPFLETIAATLQHQAAAAGAEFHIAALPDLLTDRLVLEQIFSNLLENALKYRHPARPARIEVTGSLEGPPKARIALFEVTDNGRGIAPRDLERIFELFRRAGDQSVPGEGIGLATSAPSPRRLGGRIDCVSTEGVGSTFLVRIPATIANPSTTARTQEPALS